jgi:hypothetical protein
MADEDVSVLADEPGWTVTGIVAVYEPTPGGWRARVVRTVVSGRTYFRYHIALVAPDAIARHTTTANGIDQARIIAERQAGSSFRGTNGSSPDTVKRPDVPGHPAAEQQVPPRREPPQPAAGGDELDLSVDIVRRGDDPATAPGLHPTSCTAPARQSRSSSWSSATTMKATAAASTSPPAGTDPARCPRTGARRRRPHAPTTARPTRN